MTTPSNQSRAASREREGQSALGTAPLRAAVLRNTSVCLATCRFQGTKVPRPVQVTINQSGLDLDPTLTGPGKRDDDLNVDVLRSGSHHLCRAVKMRPARRSRCPIRGIGYCS
jgi:hypothetical protein